MHSPLLTTAAVQKKLARQGSKFAGCRAFRIYRFRDGAWQEIILGAVMGAAKRAEEQRAAEARDVTASVMRREDQQPRTRKATSEGVAGEAAASVDQRFTTSHGPYARAARDELSLKPDIDAEIEVRAANSNTAPVSRPAPASSTGAEERTTAVPETPTVVPLPVRPRPPAGAPLPTQVGRKRAVQSRAWWMSS